MAHDRTSAIYHANEEKKNPKKKLPYESWQCNFSKTYHYNIVIGDGQSEDYAFILCCSCRN